MARSPHYHSDYRVAVTRSLSPEDANRIMGAQLRCKGIHLPEDPSPGVLNGHAAQFWHAAFNNAQSYYDDQKIAKKTAWKSVRAFFRQQGKTWVTAAALPRPGEGPQSFIGDPGELEQLGVCVEYTFIDGDANLQIKRFAPSRAPYLYWSHPHRTCFVFPGAERSDCLAPDLAAPGADVFYRWTQRKPQCLRMVDVPEVMLQLCGLFDTVVYASDKWHDPNPDPRMQGSQEYIHQVGDGVGLWQSSCRGTPQAIVFTGGCMDLEERGLIH